MSVERSTADGMSPLLAVSQSVLVVFVAFLSAFAVVGLGANLLVAAGVSSGSLQYRVLSSVLQFVGFGVGVGGYLVLAGYVDVVRIRVPTLRDAAWTVAGVVGILLTAAVIGQVLSTLGVSVAQNQVIETGKRNPQYFLYMIPVTLLFVGPFEELVFRGTVQGLLRRAFSPGVAIGIASAMFGVVHWIALTGGGSRLSYIVVAAGLGVILGYTYERTQNLVVPAVIHGTYNAVLFGLQYAAATGLFPT